MHQASPTGAVHEVGVDQIFFSTTDDRGVITAANDVFIDLSRHPREELIGAPHNVIRHPDMPRGTFRVMWDRLQAKTPFAGYVRNLASDGSAYTVFATVTPMPGSGYLSVRTRPMCEDVAEMADSLYRQIRERESSAAEEGAGGRDVAAVGAEALAEMLNEAGFADYAEFQREVLPAEVAAREAAGAGLPDVPECDGRLAEVDAAVREIFGELDASMAAQDDIVDLARSLKRCGRKIRHDMDTAATITDRLEDTLKDDPTHVADMMPVRVWSQMRGIAARYTGSLLDSLEDFTALGAETRFQVALARLQTTELASFVAEVAAGGAESHHAAKAIRPLCGVLHEEVSAMDDQTRLHRERAADVAEHIDRVVEIMRIPQQVAVAWSKGVPSMGLTGEISSLAASMAAAVVSAGAAISELEALRERCRDIGDVEHSVRLRELIDTVRDFAVEDGASADDEPTEGGPTEGEPAAAEESAVEAAAEQPAAEEAPAEQPAEEAPAEQPAAEEVTAEQPAV
ncbi:hypothetical protein ACFORJ_03105 [Corynebacterium hansenii]|uniref:Aerotaxis receptor n=1 Tax=Corynebacterium hansenii TaxID=394964 RepID=A0ABV7ZKV3_9CORY|nr:hypothetical protein [Corynebacterium hansenii]WJY99011.1 Aerotaxis receptor [Corynebacterium hansenii]